MSRQSRGMQCGEFFGQKLLSSQIVYEQGSVKLELFHYRASEKSGMIEKNNLIDRI